MEGDQIASGGSSIELYLAEGDERAGGGEFQRRVWEELEWEALVQGADLYVEIVDRVAVLDGTVDHYPAKMAAGRAARRVEGIQDVDNRIRVRAPTTNPPADADLAATAERVLDWSALVPRGGIALQVEGGVLVLTGEVSRECERAAAEDVVSRLAGVADIRNRVTVRPAVAVERLQEHVTEALRHEHARHVSADTLGDEVVLRGRARSLAQRDALERAVWAVPGVRSVRDEVRIDR